MTAFFMTKELSEGYVKNSARSKFYFIIEEARQHGIEAAKKQYEKLTRNSQPNKMLDHCGGSSIVLIVDGRSKMGEFLSSLIERPMPNLRIDKSQSRKYRLHIKYNIKNCQWCSVYEAADDAALKVLKKSLNIKGYVQDYLA
jgi:hypothetical protein